MPRRALPKIASLAALCGLATLLGGAVFFPPAGTAPTSAVASTGLVYASPTAVVINSATTRSVFPDGSAASRTVPANTLTPGRSFTLLGGGVYTVPTGNLNTADINLTVGSTTIVAVTTPAAPVGTNAGVDFHSECVVNTATTITCTGVFTFAVLGTTPVIVPFNSVAAKTFDPTVANVIDVTGDWNTGAGALTTQSTRVQTAVLVVRN